MQKVMSRAGENPIRDVQAYSVLAMAQLQLQQTNAARATLAKAVEIEETKLPRLDSGDLGGGWRDWIIAHALLNEARALVEGGSKPANEVK